MKLITIKKIITGIALCMLTQQLFAVKVEVACNKTDNKTTCNNCINDIMKTVKDPNIIVWFGGEDGLLKKGVDYYKEQLLTPLSTMYKDSPYSLYLYDLRSWTGLRQNNFDPCDMKKSVFWCALKNNALSNKSWQIVYSTDFFKWLTDLSREEKEIVSKILQQEQIFEQSKKKKSDSMLTLCKTKLQAPVLKDFEKTRTAKIYSALQYLEAIFLIKKIVQQTLRQRKIQEPTSIVFLLPKGEIDYYIFNNNSSFFKNNIEAILNTDQNIKNSQANVDIFFQEFMYDNKNPDARPYIKQGKEKCVLQEEIQKYFLKK